MGKLFSISVIVIVTISLRLYNINGNSFWLDEVYSTWFAKKSLNYIWTIGPSFEVHPPLYYTLLHVWILLGDSETTLRLLSVLISVLTVPLVYGLGRTIGGANRGHLIGLLASTLFAVSSLQIRFAQEARSYAFLAAAVTVVLLGAAWIMRNPDRAAVPILARSPDGGRLAWAAVAFGGATTLWLHNIGVLYMSSILGVLLTWCMILYKTHKHLLYNAIIVLSIIALIWLPWIPHILFQMRLVTSGFWIATPDYKIVFGTAVTLFGFESIPSIIHAPILIGIYGLYAMGRRYGWPVASLFMSALLMPLLLALAVSLMAAPIFLPRTLTASSVPYYVLLSIGFIDMRLPFLKKTIAVFMPVLLIFNTVDYFRDDSKEPWREIAENIISKSVSEKDESNIVLAVPNFAAIPLQYYFDRKNYNVSVIPLPSEFPDFNTVRAYVAMPGASEIHETDLKLVADLVRDRKEVWLVTRKRDWHDPDGIVENWLRARLDQTYAQNFQLIEVFHFVMDTP